MYEINLVPDVKAEMIKAQKLRNFVLLICLIVSIAAAAIVLIFFGIKTGQDIAMGNQDKRIKTMSAKLEEYDGLDEVLTLQYQLNMIDEIAQNKTMLSRVFNVFSVLLPTGADTIALSELNINVPNSTLSFDAQADAGEAPYIDYRVLEAFKKSVGLMKYDYGRYVDKEGNEIPTMCIIEADSLGNAFVENGNTYAKWAKNVKGCDPSKSEEMIVEEDEEGEKTEEAEENEAKMENAEVASVTEATVSEAINGGDYVVIWRTPQIKDTKDKKGWYSAGYMDLDGGIKGVEHFESQCTKYSGEVVGSKVQWTSSNECDLAPEGLVVTSSSNGKDADNNLVLRFSATINLAPEVFRFQNKHLLAIAPTGRQNVTDSYSQIEGMFKEPAKDCLAGDLTCDNTVNEKGEEEE